jgi:hypothetical protein
VSEHGVLEVSSDHPNLRWFHPPHAARLEQFVEG